MILRNQCEMERIEVAIMQLSSSLFGYNKTEVDRALQEKDAQIEALNKQISEIQTQLNEYIEMEQALKDGIVDARMTGNKIVAESNDEAEKILKRTNEQVTQYKEEFAHHSHELVNSGMGMREMMKKMQNEMQDVVATYQEMLENTDFDSLYPEDQISRFSGQIEAYENMEISTPRQQKKKLWDNTSITEEEKKELEKLIHEVIANEKQEPASASESKLVKFAKM